jgi:hypothetical protein
MHSARPAPTRCAILAISLIGLTAMQLACATGRPGGPVFERLAPPDSSSTLVYIYRQDTQRGVDGSRLKLDGDRLVDLRNGEYVAVVLDPGEHVLSASLFWFGLIARSWNSLAFTAQGGETLYIKLWAATSEIAAPPGANELPGRSDRRADVGLYMSRVSADDAQVELRVTRRAQLR